jgi:ribose-phosphate pyrophosphokinase
LALINERLKTMSITFSGSDGMSEPISNIGMYSDSTPMVKTLGWDRILKQADTLTITGGSMAQFVTAMFLVDAVDMHAEGGGIKRLIMPYIPGARQDRSNPTGDVLFTLASVGDMINARGFNEVVVLDPHSFEAQEHIHRLVKYPLRKIARTLDSLQPEGYAGVIAADKGGKARAEEMAEALHVPVFYGGKMRDVRNGKLTGFSLEPLKGGNWTKPHYLVVDDICDGGGTFNGLAAKIHEQGATADLYVSHGIFSKGTRALEENYGKIYTTDSLAGSERDDTNVTVLAVVGEMEKYNV